LLAIGLAALLARFPSAAETLYGARVGPFLAWLLATVTGFLPVAIVEVLLLAWVGTRGWQAARGLADAFHGRRRWRNALGSGALVLGADVGLAVALFYGLWGFGYARPPIDERLGLPDGDEVPIAVVSELADELIDAVNDAYVAIHDTTDAGAPTTVADERTLERAIETGWRETAAELGLGGTTTWPWPRTKRLVSSPLLHRMGLSGFYCPFTGEANVNAGVPAAYRAHTIAHEKAHQRGINPENEANFLGFVAGAAAPNPVARYSAFLFAQRQLLRTMIRAGEESKEEARALVERRLPGVQRDVNDLNEYWSRYQGRTRRLAHRMNDAYLKSNRVEDGVLAYGRSVELIVAWARSRGGRLTAEPRRPRRRASADRGGRRRRQRSRTAKRRVCSGETGPSAAPSPRSLSGGPAA
jgi:hypothetical protein